MSIEETFSREATNLRAVEQQANSQEVDSLLFFERLHNPTIRKQIIDLLYEAEQSRSEDVITSAAPDREGKRIRKEGGEYVPKSRTEIEKDFDQALVSIESDTPVSFHDRQPTLHGKRELLPLCWKLPNGEKPSTKMWSIIEAHEKGHAIRPYSNRYITKKLQGAFDIAAVEFTEEEYRIEKSFQTEGRTAISFEDARKGYLEYLFSGSEMVERMSQLKNYFGMKGNEVFTREHLRYAREHYSVDTGMDNRMTPFFKAVTLEKEDLFVALINSVGV
jgi:hypothetical protein